MPEDDIAAQAEQIIRDAEVKMTAEDMVGPSMELLRRIQDLPTEQRKAAMVKAITSLLLVAEANAIKQYRQTVLAFLDDIADIPDAFLRVSIRYALEDEQFERILEDRAKEIRNG